MKMIKNLNINYIIAFASGIILTVIIVSNSIVAKHTSPYYASAVLYAVGTISSLILAIITHKSNKPNDNKAQLSILVYSGGILGILTTISDAITTNSPLSFVGSFALILLAQVIYGVLSDKHGFFGTTKRIIKNTDWYAILLICSGSIIIIKFGQ